MARIIQPEQSRGTAPQAISSIMKLQWLRQSYWYTLDKLTSRVKWDGMEWDRIEGSETNPHTYVTLINNKSDTSLRKGVFIKQSC